MAHKLEKFYSSFGGVDTRSNKLAMPQNTFRNGSKNFRYNFQDDIQNANGFQHKSAVTPVPFIDIFEYKFNDVNTGAAKSQLLAVGNDGNLYRRKQSFLKWITHGAAASYSFYYDEVGDTFVLSVNGAGSVNVSDVMTMAQLKVALNALAGVSVDIVDEAGAPVVSTDLAYQLDVRIEDSFKLNASWSWEVVPCSGIPFPNAITQPEGYEGVSSQNLNNVIYITDGWFPMKYDGRSVYRAGMPKFSRDLGINGFLPSDDASGNLTPNSNYTYILQFGFVDSYGAETLGKILSTDYFFKPLPAGKKSISLPIYPIGNADATNDCFPVYSCAVNGNQTLAGTGNKTLTVKAGHNIKVGMCLRVTVSNLGFPGISQGISYGYLKVSAVTATTITFNKTIGGLTFLSSGTFSGSYCAMVLNNTSTQLPDLFPDGFILNGCYVPTNVEGVFSEPQVYDNEKLGMTQAWSPGLLYGAFVRVFRSNGGQPDQLYKVGDLPISHNEFYRILDQLTDNTADLAPGIGDTVATDLTTIQIDYSAGEELPRACKYMTKWQGTLVQAGRPVNEAGILEKSYPWFFAPPPPASGNKWNQHIPFPPWTYQETNLCDLQSFYWADPITPEGFPQDGLHEFRVDTEFSDRIMGIAPNKDALFALKERSTGIVTGDLGVNDLTLEVLEDDIGLASHKTLLDVKGALVWLDPKRGFYSCVAGRLPIHIGYPISDYQQNNFQKLDYSKATAMNNRSQCLYMCAVGSTWFIFDYADTGRGLRNCWYIWERFSVASACYTSRDECLLLGGQVWQMKVTNTRWDMTDHKSAIEFDARCAWLNFGLPTIDKHFERCWLNSIQGGFKLTIDQYGNYLEDLISSIDIVMKEAPKKVVKDHIKAAIPKLSAISFGFRNAEKNRLVKIQGFEVEHSVDYDTGEPKR